ncbi:MULTISPECIES: antibiotic biosynthesis monooxygenase family protein [Micrococcales]|uniref:Antibiotic biosynthesis monooxygenase n=6 Tax=Micrococcales TaxID=85006 RepID=A0A2A3YG15_9MICO|nr:MULTISPECIES: antibiotic biosynthesis monooxygenase [Micrococcales]PZP32706.1 MAG: antibiotic biosynthesis monooxygenase [Kocuria rhizophila]AZT91838.1 antibiotic biosynthesis monooxygenase [Brevibacterium aurantiacum]KAB1943453.1 antibiotic biosynthesis monooxygenase [Brevibacterium linens ATCC 9172]MBP2407958.1 heme-degrading monooxygenase HmoA [Brachybacterium fresconis]MDN5773866.1 antibiotic biosynthesis monooxygenase [Brevibacterium aurantiacum]
MSNPVTFVNVIDVEPEKQPELVELLKEGTEKVMKHRPGFISVTLLASADKTRVLNVAQWESADDVKATQSDPEAAEYAKKTAGIAKASPGLYQVVGEYK